MAKITLLGANVSSRSRAECSSKSQFNRARRKSNKSRIFERKPLYASTISAVAGGLGSGKFVKMKIFHRYLINQKREE